MKKLNSIDEILDFAISGEIKAYELYMDMAAMVENQWICKSIEGMAQEELQHQAKLKAVKARKIALKREEVDDLGIADTIENIKPQENMDYRELLMFAIKKENVSHGLYSRLALIFPEPELKDIFLKLAKEEAEHKRRFEMQYESLTS
ncbi:MAG: ferritin family protein [Planctomycetota bacterium]